MGATTPERIATETPQNSDVPLANVDDPLPSTYNQPSCDADPAPNLAPTDDKVPAPPARHRMSNARRYLLFTMFCVANMLDAYNLNALFTALPVIRTAFGLNEADASWIMSAFELTYAAFMLVSGRISDIYHPKAPFITGVFGLAILSLGSGFVKSGVGLIIIRAVCGICAALSIPSSLALIVRLFPEPQEQSVAIALFGGVGALGNVFGTMISAVFIEFASYRWVFFFTTIIGVPAAAVCLVLVPSSDSEGNTEQDKRGSASWLQRLKKLDQVGVAFLTVALILFIFAITSGSEDGWSSARVLAPLIISVFMTTGFFFWEARMPAEDAAVPPRTWFLPNFAVLFGASLLPYFWWTTVFAVFFPLWQQVYGWSAIKSGLRMIAIGISATVISFTSSLGRYVPRKLLIVAGHVLAIAGTILLTFGDAEDDYWRLVFPGLIIGSAGAMVIYMHVSIAIFQTAPSSMAGVVGAMFNCALQLGAALGLAIDTSIETSLELEDGPDGFFHFRGRRAVLWWLVAAVCAEMVAILVFFRTRGEPTAVSTDEKLGGMDEEVVRDEPRV
ncbi:MFS general substrate transporter [Trametes coccinea BRFM310]|uniref:MFS general substrate transporter n=1 Tax=Trametes coccinea (strain BRFM310) TaxID=1353009 RepID=A0A1Y2I7E1_TRAC3|nr:MFS general substrate transporter [Trametes coccinea BRFM310]